MIVSSIRYIQMAFVDSKKEAGTTTSIVRMS